MNELVVYKVYKNKLEVCIYKKFNFIEFVSKSHIFYECFMNIEFKRISIFSFRIVLKKENRIMKNDNNW